MDQTFAGLVETPPEPEFFPELYDQFRSADAWRIYDDVVPFLEVLRRRGLKVGRVSNWDERLRPLLHTIGLAVWFDAIVISAEFGAGQTAPLRFPTRRRAIANRSGSILHLGDSRVEDFEAARAAGFQALLLRRGQPPQTSAQVPSLAEALLRL